ncbi:hypothetical protein Tco_0461029 [Tanacetum coccineum]
MSVPIKIKSVQIISPEDALVDTIKDNWRLASFVHLLDRLLFVHSWFCQTFYTTKSSFVGWFTYLHSPATTTKWSPNYKSLHHQANFCVQLVHKVLYNREDTISWLQRSDIKHSYYLPILAMKLVMLLCLIFLEQSDCSQVLLNLLSGSRSIAYMLPKRFVSSLLRRRKGCRLNLNPEVVAEAFISIDDSLLVVCSEDERPKIHAPCAIFVNLRNSREEVMSVLFQTKSTLCAQNPWNDNGCGTIAEVTCSNTLGDANRNENTVDGCRGELQIERKA